jgi:hypothetical protein
LVLDIGLSKKETCQRDRPAREAGHCLRRRPCAQKEFAALRRGFSAQESALIAESPEIARRDSMDRSHFAVVRARLGSNEMFASLTKHIGNDRSVLGTNSTRL